MVARIGVPVGLFSGTRVNWCDMCCTRGVVHSGVMAMDKHEPTCICFACCEDWIDHKIERLSFFGYVILCVAGLILTYPLLVLFLLL